MPSGIFLSSQNPGDIALTITPADKGRLEVYIQNEKIPLMLARLTKGQYITVTLGKNGSIS